MPTVRGHGLFKYGVGQPYMYPRNEPVLRWQLLAHDVWHALRRLQGQPVIERAMDRIFILHADHEQNASTSTCAPVRLFRHSTVCGHRRCGLPRPCHGGANEACLNMLEEIQKMGGVAKVEVVERSGQELRRQKRLHWKTDYCAAQASHRTDFYPASRSRHCVSRSTYSPASSPWLAPCWAFDCLSTDEMIGDPEYKRSAVRASCSPVQPARNVMSP